MLSYIITLVCEGFSCLIHGDECYYFMEMQKLNAVSKSLDETLCQSMSSASGRNYSLC